MCTFKKWPLNTETENLLDTQLKQKNAIVSTLLGNELDILQTALDVATAAAKTDCDCAIVFSIWKKE